MLDSMLLGSWSIESFRSSNLSSLMVKVSIEFCRLVSVARSRWVRSSVCADVVLSGSSDEEFALSSSM